MTDDLCPTCNQPLRFSRVEIWRCTDPDCGREVERAADAKTLYCDYCGADITKRDHFVDETKHLLICPPCWGDVEGMLDDELDDHEAPDTLVLPPNFREDFLRRARGGKS